LADAGFDGKEVWEALRGEGLRPVIRLRGGGEARMEARVRAREGWDPEVYRFRGVVEGVFGGMKRRLGGAYLWERKPWTAMVRAFLELIAYGLRVLLSLLPPPPGRPGGSRKPSGSLRSSRASPVSSPRTSRGRTWPSP
jgi:hypothetical protein